MDRSTFHQQMSRHRLDLQNARAHSPLRVKQVHACIDRTLDRYLGENANPDDVAGEPEWGAQGTDPR